MTNGSDFSRYGKTAREYLIGTFLCLYVTAGFLFALDV